MFNLNSGYYGLSKSKNAHSAENGGLFPQSAWVKKSKDDILMLLSDYLLDYVDDLKKDLNKDVNLTELINQFNKLTKTTLLSLISYKEWHHTGASFKETDYYGFDYDLIIKKIKDNFTNIKKAKKEKVNEDDGYIHGYYSVSEYHPCSRYNKYHKSWVPFVNGKVKGKRVYLPDGSYKTSVKILKETKRKLSKKEENAFLSKNKEYKEF